MPDKELRYSGSFCSRVFFAILHLGLFFAQLCRRVDWIQHCGALVFEKFRFHCPHENTTTEFSKISTLEGVFGHRFHRIRVDGRQIHEEKVAFANENGYVWTGPKSIYH